MVGGASAMLSMIFPKENLFTIKKNTMPSSVIDWKSIKIINGPYSHWTLLILLWNSNFFWKKHESCKEPTEYRWKNQGTCTQ